MQKVSKPNVNIEWVSLSEIKPYENNAKVHTKERIQRLADHIKKYGWDQAIVVDETGVILKGHRRRLAAIKLELKAVPIIRRTELSEGDKIAIRLFDNKDAEDGQYDQDKLKADFVSLAQLGFPLIETGFPEAEIVQWVSFGEGGAIDLSPAIEENKEPEETDDDEDVPPIPAQVPARVKPGQAWKLGRHLLVCGDSADAALVHKYIGESEGHAIVSDPPYGLGEIKDLSGFVQDWLTGGSGDAFVGNAGFMGKWWDRTVPPPALWKVWLSRARPGAHAVVFSGTRTQDLMTLSLRIAGVEVRDQLAWVYGQGFPKSLDVSKAIDKEAGAEGTQGNLKRGGERLLNLTDGKRNGNGTWGDESGRNAFTYVPATDAAREWEGWGTAIKPSTEPVTLARVPFDYRAYLSLSAQSIKGIICQCLLPARDATQLSTSSQNDTKEVCGSVQWNAVNASNTLADLLDLTDMLQSESAENTNLNTALSWLHTLGEVCKRMSMCTTETVSNLTTALKTLSYCLLKITHANTIKDPTRQSGLSENAERVVRALDALLLLSENTQGFSAIENAISPDLATHLDVHAKAKIDPITLARVPLSEDTVAKNVLKWGTGGLNIDGCRVEYRSENDKKNNIEGLARFNSTSGNSGSFMASKEIKPNLEATAKGRFPANLILDEEAAQLLDEQSGISESTARVGKRTGKDSGVLGAFTGQDNVRMGHDDVGGSSRFFYVAKASKSDRGEGNNHATVKPIKLMRYLVRLVTMPGGTVLEPFCGSGTTLLACEKEGLTCKAFEMDAHHCDIILHRFQGLTGIEPELIN